MTRGGALIEYLGKRGTVWRIKYRDASGRQVMETLGRASDGWTRKKAEAELRERLVKVERKGYRRPSKVTFREYAERWHVQGQRRRGWKPRSVKAYAVSLRRLNERLGPVALQEIRPRHVAAYVSAATERYGANTINVDLSVLHDVLASAVREELLETNPAARAERPKRPKRPKRQWRILEPVEVKRVAAAFEDEQARTAFWTLVLTGVRQGELRALLWRDVDLIENVLRVRDSKSEEGVRSIALSPMLAKELWQHRRRTAFSGDEERVFCHPETGGPFPPDDFREALNAALRAAGVEGYVRPFHDLRHTSLTNGAAAGEHPIALMTRAGHRSMATTNGYLHLAGMVFRDEAEALEKRLLGVPKAV